MTRDTDVHTCHAECPCQTGGEPRPDFLPVEGYLLAFIQRGVAAQLSIDELVRKQLEADGRKRTDDA